ncbi:GntR family transcriptional regulator [Lentibacillus sp. N15]|uniref:GntR family transcriptional regulator n=1 Tax=Lentibacillus songyuanensis TaxID=3136161 RepID=UPI0031BB99BE
MLIHLSPNNPKPMYEQVVDEIERLIATGIMAPGEMLPSIRALSKELMTSGITIRRAYQELERSGFIYTRAGKGSFVSSLSETKLTQWKMSQVQEPLRESIQRAKNLQLSEAQFLKVTKQLWTDSNEEEQFNGQEVEKDDQ